MVRKVDSDGGKMVSSVGTRCLQNSPSENIDAKLEIRACSAGERGLSWIAPAGITSSLRHMARTGITNQLLCSDAPKLSIYNILDLAKHKTVDDKAHKEGSFTNLIFFLCEKQFRHLSSIHPYSPPLKDSILYKRGSLCQSPEGLLTHLRKEHREK